MALGGGIFSSQNQGLPGSYINFISASSLGSVLSDRGISAFPMTLSWGVDGEVFTVTADEFRRDSLKIFGYPYTADELRGLRELFLNVKACHLFKLNTGGVKASCTYCDAKYTGSRGNQIKIVIAANENSELNNNLWDVTVLFDGITVDEQYAVANTAALKDNAYVTWKTAATLSATTGTTLTGGTDGTVSDSNYQTFLDKIESYQFNTIGTTSNDTTIKALFAAWTKRMRDTVGIKIQCVLYKYEIADYEGIISVENKLKGEVANESGNLVYWVTGAEAGCRINENLTNAVYTGEYDIDTSYTQMQLWSGLWAGKLMFHKVNNSVRVLEDVNTLVTVTDSKGEDFKSNQTIRILDQIANDIANIFNTKYLGKIPNDNSGRISLWSDIIKNHKSLETMGAIENFEPDKVKVEPGETKKAVTISDCVTPVNAMTQLYMTIIVE